MAFLKKYDKIDDMKVTDTYLAEITDFGLDGKGFSKIEDIAVFTPYTAAGDLAKIKIKKVYKGVAEADAVKIVRPASCRVVPPCKTYGECGGCVLQHVDFPTENELKRKLLQTTLNKAGINVRVSDTVFDKEYEYRNKLQMPFTVDGGGITLGFFRRNTHDVVALSGCMLHGDFATKIINAVKIWANDEKRKQKLSVYDEATGKGLLRHFVARYVDGLLFATVVINGKTLPYGRELFEVLSKDFECVLYSSVNEKRTNVIMGDDVKKLYGAERDVDIDGIKTTLSPKSFLQVNDGVRQKLYDGVNAAVKNADVIIDVYSGIGILTSMLAKANKNAKVYGVEIVKEAVENANDLMKKNGLSGRVENICGDATKVLPKLVNDILSNEKSGIKPEICVVIDPPRKGATEEVLDAVIRSGAEKFVYVSCNPKTLQRDVKYVGDTFEVASVTPYNMFPKTAELETLCVMKRKSL